MPINPNVELVISKLKTLRESNSISASQMDSLLKVGPGWTESLEAGKIEPKLDMILSIVDLLDIDFNTLLSGLHLDKGQGLSRQLFALEYTAEQALDGSQNLTS